MTGLVSEMHKSGAVQLSFFSFLFLNTLHGVTVRSLTTGNRVRANTGLKSPANVKVVLGP